jgi:hypothetical protein
MSTRQNKIKNILNDFVEGFRADYSIGGEDQRLAMHRRRELQGEQAEAPKMALMGGAYQPGIRALEVLDKASPEGLQARKEMDMAFEGSKARRAGQVAGTIANDLTQDATRRFYWLLNAAQATGEVINESLLARANPNLYGKRALRLVQDEKGRRINKRGEDAGTPILAPSKGGDQDVNQDRLDVAYDLGIIDKDNKPKRGYSVIDVDDNERAYAQRNFEPGFIQSLAIPSGIAINTGLGLMTPFGGAEGYKAAMPSEEDPTETSNVLGEVALKYFMGRTGDLLPYDEFVKVRPDVSKDEYQRYKAFKYDKNIDVNPFDDGQVTLPGGILKVTDEGIHGPEAQFLGRSLPATTALIPYAGAVAGGMLGVRSKTPIRSGFLGGMGGLATGQIVGNIIENERRRRNTVENELGGI